MSGNPVKKFGKNGKKSGKSGKKFGKIQWKSCDLKLKVEVEDDPEGFQWPVGKECWTWSKDRKLPWRWSCWLKKSMDG